MKGYTGGNSKKCGVVQAKQTYVSAGAPRKQFALIRHARGTPQFSFIDYVRNFKIQIYLIMYLFTNITKMFNKGLKLLIRHLLNFKQ